MEVDLQVRRTFRHDKLRNQNARFRVRSTRRRSWEPRCVGMGFRSNHTIWWGKVGMRETALLFFVPWRPRRRPKSAVNNCRGSRGRMLEIFRQPFAKIVMSVRNPVSKLFFDLRRDLKWSSTYGGTHLCPTFQKSTPKEASEELSLPLKSYL